MVSRPQSTPTPAMPSRSVSSPAEPRAAAALVALQTLGAHESSSAKVELRTKRKRSSVDSVSTSRRRIVHPLVGRRVRVLWDNQGSEASWYEGEIASHVNWYEPEAEELFQIKYDDGQAKPSLRSACTLLEDDTAMSLLLLNQRGSIDEKEKQPIEEPVTLGDLELELNLEMQMHDLEMQDYQIDMEKDQEMVNGHKVLRG